MQTVTSETVKSGDVTLHLRRLGNRAQLPVLFVHGLSYFSFDWLPAAQALAGEREVACLDQRGFGESTWSAAKDYSVPTMGADLVAVLDHLGWQRALIVGHSMGGRASTYAAAKHPARLAGLALVDYTPDNAPAGSQRVARSVVGVPERFASIEEALRHFGSTDRERYAAYLKPVEGGFALKRDPHFRDQFRKALETGERPKPGVDMWALIGEVRCPILSIRGSRSDLYAPETAAKMQAANPKLQVVEVDAGHNVAGENLEGFLAALSPFLRRMEEDHVPAT